jgi:hypothetical protein
MSFTEQDARNEGWAKMPAYLDGHCAGFNGWPAKELPGVDGQAYDRGYEVGSIKAREISRQTDRGYEAGSVEEDQIILAIAKLEISLRAWDLLPNTRGRLVS